VNTVQTYFSIGITGSRQGLSPEQSAKLTWTLAELRNNRAAARLHHGDCQGVDDSAARIARGLGYRIIGHPPLNKKLRAFFPSDETRSPAPYLVRNRRIVNEVELLIGCPNTNQPTAGSGTWYTIEFAYRTGTKIAVIGPDGHWLAYP